MSQENVEIVRGMQPPPDFDLVGMFDENASTSILLDAVAPSFHSDVEAVGKLSIGDVRGSGMEGLKAVWREWLQPWESYRSEVEDVIDIDDRVVVLVRDFGRRKGMTAEVALVGAAIWTLRDGKVARVEFFADRAVALEAVGLAE
ncbi:MAG: nuclear transport factor 2 family protein [Solirubrobacterales bacterium]|nr:nuclear transport factor 2 family protein [Solirubrobacterales bacterium]